MSNIRRISVLAFILLFVGIVGSLLTFHNSNKLVSVAETKEISNQNFNALRISINDASVTMIPTKSTTTKVELKGKRSTDSIQKLSVGVKGKTLTVQLTDRQRKFFNFDFLRTSVALKVYVPEKLYKSIKIDCDNGRIELAGMQASHVYARTNNGHIELQNIKAAMVDVFSDNGVILLNDVDGKITGSTNNGKITLETISLDRPIQLECDNGNITIKTDKEPTNVTFDVHVDNGKVNILDKYSNSSVIGKGKNLIKLSTNNGKIEVTK